MSLRDEYIKAGIIKPQSKLPDLPHAMTAVQPVAKQPIKAKPPTKEKPAKTGKGKAAPKKLSKHNQISPKEIIPDRMPVRCVLCGELIKPGKMELHKTSMHGESSAERRTPASHFEPPKAVIFRGGGTGLKG